MKTDFLELFTITNEKNDRYGKEAIIDVLPHYKWNDVLAMLKTMGLSYNKAIWYDKKRGVIEGIKRINNTD